MSFQSESGVIRWKLHFTSSREAVYDALATESGRASYWAESAPEHNDVITFHILGYEPNPGKILKRVKPSLFVLEYFGTNVKFELRDEGANGTEMKAAVDFGVDLRNHSEKRSWNEGYVDN